ncbi:TLR4 interactor with leucine rich repeats-like [Anopheles marshallii]|uniref:TLR4 interactor with leucine rich repeats-like n=1 Tax=Anopheles marshallii TaxID=1521116 RepID=UPI00237C3AB1|nr:TLR4 interactor with leucine rich repeats-like [Anopheles marshallii]
MTSGGGLKLLKTLETEQEVYIRKLVVAISPSGVFLQKISHLVDYVMYTDYREPTFNLPEDLFWWILVTWYQLEMHLCDGQCIRRMLFICDVGVINMTSDGRVKLMKVIDRETVVRVEKMIVAISPTGQFLQTISPFIDSITYGNYHEPTFLVPEGNTITEINFMRATSLRAFIAGSNTGLEILNIQYSELDRLPKALPKLDRLKELNIQYGMLSVLRLDMLMENQNLTTLDLSHNQIRQIFPVTAYPGTMLSIEKLILNGNLLERLDMAVFAPMSKLDFFQVLENRLTQLDASIPTTFAKLSTLNIGDNKIRTVDLRNLTLPSLLSVSFGPNNLKQMPALPKMLPALEYMSLAQNNLTQLDLGYFRQYQKLKYVYIMSNQITAVRTSSPVKLSILWLNLATNKITSFNITGCGLPNMTSLNLRGNRLTVVPPVFARFPKLSVTLDMNPITCDTLLLYKDQIKNDKLYKDRVSPSWACDTTSSFLVGEQIKICCDS